jgi:hypothetical protein
MRPVLLRVSDRVVNATVVDATGTPVTYARRVGMSRMFRGWLGLVGATLAAAGFATEARASYGGGGCHRCAPAPIVATVALQPQYETVMQTVYETVYEQQPYTVMQTRYKTEYRDLDGHAQLHRLASRLRDDCPAA